MKVSRGRIFRIRIAVLACVIVLAIAYLPHLGIWALNTLFGLSIAYSLKTWFASLLIFGVVSHRAGGGK